MTYSTSYTYQMKREILNFSHKISHKPSNPDRKFSADITYGMLAAQSCLLANTADQLHEDCQKGNTDEPVSTSMIFDVIKPDGFKFEALGIVRDGLKSTPTKNVYEKTEAVALTKISHPVSIFSKIHSSAEKNFSSINTITFSAMERSTASKKDNYPVLV